MIGLHHIIIALAFFAGAVLIDIDHIQFCSPKAMIKGLYDKDMVCGEIKETPDRVKLFMHNALTYLVVTAFWLGYSIHLIADYYK